MKKIRLVKTAIIKDGGTLELMEESVKNDIKSIRDAQTAKRYYLDNRIRTTTRGELFDAYPSKPEAIMLNKDDYEIVSMQHKILVDK